MIPGIIAIIRLIYSAAFSGVIKGTFCPATVMVNVSPSAFSSISKNEIKVALTEATLNSPVLFKTVKKIIAKKINETDTPEIPMTCDLERRLLERREYAMPQGRTERVVIAKRGEPQRHHDKR